MKNHSRYIYWAAGASGAAGLIYEVAWSRALSNTIGATTYSFSILLAAFMAGLAIGGYYGGKYISDRQDAIRVFGLLQLGIALVGGVTLYAINGMPPVYAQLYFWLKQSFNAFTMVQAAAVFLVMLVPTTLMGATFPVAVKAWSERREDIGRNVGDIYSINTWGAVIGVIAAGFIFIPLFGLRWTNLFAGSINLLLATLAFLSLPSRRLIGVAALVALVSIGFALLRPASGLAFSYGLADHHVDYADFKATAAGFNMVFDKESAYGRVQVGVDRDLPSSLFLVNGGRYEGSTYGDATTTRLLSYLPLAVHEKPDDVLVIGLGLGRTVNTAARDDRVKRVDNVEINPVVNEAVELYFFPGLFDDPSVTAINDDGRHHVLVTDRKYDVIISQPSYPTSNGVSHLFTADFYRLAKKKLKRGGIYVQWLPEYLLDDSEMQSAIKTVLSEFPSVYSWHSEAGDVILLSSTSQRKIDPDRVKERIDALGDPSIHEWSFVAGPKELAKIAKDPSVPINTDDLPLIEFASAKNKVTRNVRQ